MEVARYEIGSKGAGEKESEKDEDKERAGDARIDFVMQTRRLHKQSERSLDEWQRRKEEGK